MLVTSLRSGSCCDEELRCFAKRLSQKYLVKYLTGGVSENILTRKSRDKSNVLPAIKRRTLLRLCLRMRR